MSGVPPPVDLNLGSGRRGRAVAAIIWMAATLALVVWLRGPWMDAGLAWLAAAALGGAFLGWAIARPMRGHLIWDGRAWSWQGSADAEPKPLAQLRLALDFGGAVLLRAGEGRWCLVTAGDAGRQWHGLQLALRLGAGPLSQESAR
jgi:hypothetical protein